MAPLWNFITILFITYVASVFIYKQELHQVEVYLDEVLPSVTTFNENEYNLDITNECPLSGTNIEDQQQCQAQVCTKHANRSAFWTPKRDIQKFHRHHLPDCHYDISLKSVVMEGKDAKIEALRFVEYTFLVEQKCTESSVKIVGGTTFDLFAYSNDAIAICSSADHFNGTYSIYCSVPVLSSSKQHCIYLTVVLDHEHFDAYSLVLGTNDDYSNVRQILLDNVTFCAHITNDIMLSTVDNSDYDAIGFRRTCIPPELKSGRDHSHFTAVAASIANASVGGGVSNVIRMFSGLWIRQEQPPRATVSHVNRSLICPAHPLILSLENCNVFPSREHCPIAWIMNTNRNISMNAEEQQHLLELQWELLATRSASALGSPSWWNNRHGCMLEAIRYKNISNHIQLLDVNIPSIASSAFWVDAFSFRPLRLDLTVGSRVFNWSVPSFTSRIHLLRQLSNNTSMIIKFIGASHMRYLMMSMLEVVYGHQSLQDIGRKVHKCSYRNMDFDGARYANEHVAVMKRGCVDWGLDASINSSNDGVFVVQAGDWDLTVGITRFLRDPSYGLALVTFLKQLLEGEANCPVVRHVIYVTGVPHPVCMSDSGKDYCADGRKFRTNAAIAAVNTFVLRHLLAVKVHPSMKLSIVDAFSIISQRMMMNENYETICTNHYSCNVQVGWHDMMAHTIGGMAVIQGLVYALVQ